jgi:hypothetical protein
MANFNLLEGVGVWKEQLWWRVKYSQAESTPVPLKIID